MYRFAGRSALNRILSIGKSLAGMITIITDENQKLLPVDEREELKDNGQRYTVVYEPTVQNIEHDMKKVDIIYYGWLSAPNGVSSILREFSNNKEYFLDQDIILNIISHDDSHPRDFEKEKHSFSKRVKNILRKIAPHHAYLSWMLLKWTDFRFGSDIVERYLSQKRLVDIICFHDIFSCYAYLQKCRIHQVKIVLFIHNDGELWRLFKEYYPKLNGSFGLKKMESIERCLLEGVDIFGFVSQKACKVFREEHPDLLKEKTTFIYNGIKNLFYSQSIQYDLKPKYRLCCVASIKPMKGQMLILQALEALSEEERQEFSLVFVGGGEYISELISYCENHGLKEMVSFSGVVTNVEDYLAQSTIFILASYSEGLSIAILEAMRMGLPIIATDVGGASEQIEDRCNGLLVLPEVSSLTRVFRDLYSGKYELKTMGKISRKIFEGKFTIENMFDRYINLFNGLQ